MHTCLFGSVEFWFCVVNLTLFLLYLMLKNYTNYTQTMFMTPMFNKQLKKKQVEFKINTLCLQYLINSSAILLLFLNTQANKSTNGQPVFFKLLPLFLLFFSVFVTFFFKITKNNTQLNNSWTSYSFYLFLFIPTSYMIFQATNLLELILPFEIFSFLFYFVFLELSSLRTTNNTRNPLKKLLRGFMYYFWLSFVGTAFFIISSFCSITISPSIDFKTLTLVFNSLQSSSWIPTIAASCLLLGFTIKLGGLFFFFFKANAYKIMSLEGVLTLSLFTTIFYFFNLFFLLQEFSYLMTYIKWVFIPALIGFFFWFVLIFSFEISNFYLFLGVSGALTTTFCILLFV